MPQRFKTSANDRYIVLECLEGATNVDIFDTQAKKIVHSFRLNEAGANAFVRADRYAAKLNNHGLEESETVDSAASIPLSPLPAPVGPIGISLR